MLPIIKPLGKESRKNIREYFMVIMGAEFSFLLVTMAEMKTRIKYKF